MIDLHTHILPGLDDGVKTEDEALEFALLAVENGTRLIFATPQCKEGSYENHRPRIVEEVRSWLRRYAPEAPIAVCSADRLRPSR